VNVSTLPAPGDTLSLEYHARQKALRTRAQIAAERRWRTRDLLGHDLTIAARGTLDKLAGAVAVIENGRAKLNYVGRYALHEVRLRRAGQHRDTLGRCTYQPVPLPADLRPLQLQVVPQLHPVFADMFRSMGLAA
jgi:hypothetical protein